MFKQFPLSCGRGLCDCCLTDVEKINRDIETELVRTRIRNLYAGKVLLLGEC